MKGSLNFKIEGSWSKMASIGKAGNIETAWQGRGNLCGSGCHIGVTFFWLCWSQQVVSL